MRVGCGCMHAFIHMFAKKPQIDQRLYTSTVIVGRIHFDIFFKVLPVDTSIVTITA